MVLRNVTSIWPRPKIYGNQPMKDQLTPVTTIQIIKKMQ